MLALPASLRSILAVSGRFPAAERREIRVFNSSTFRDMPGLGMQHLLQATLRILKKRNPPK
jgi:hypothetical protein